MKVVVGSKVLNLEELLNVALKRAEVVVDNQIYAELETAKKEAGA